MKQYAMLWGCTVQTRLPSIEAATRRMLDVLGVSVRDLEGASCCPEPYTSALIGRELWYALAARNISLAETRNLELTTICNGCYDTLFEVNETLKQDDSLRERINSTLLRIGKEFKGSSEIRHIVEVLDEDVGLDHIAASVRRPLSNLRAALHPGCHLYRSKTVEDYDRKPKIFENLVRLTGVQLVDYGLEKMCCGYPQRQADEEMSLKATLATKLQRIQESQADCLVVVCPGCCVQFEYGQIELRQRYNLDFGVPVLHLAELMAVAVGISAGEMGLETHRSPVGKITAKLGGQ